MSKAKWEKKTSCYRPTLQKNHKINKKGCDLRSPLHPWGGQMKLSVGKLVEKQNWLLFQAPRKDNRTAQQSSPRRSATKRPRNTWAWIFNTVQTAGGSGLIISAYHLLPLRGSAGRSCERTEPQQSHLNPPRLSWEESSPRLVQLGRNGSTSPPPPLLFTFIYLFLQTTSDCFPSWPIWPVCC